MANTLRGLLDGQTIRIDNHHIGVQNVWDDRYDIHLHKKINNGNICYDIKIRLKYEQDENALGVLPARIRNEVKKAASDSERLKNFYMNVYKYLTDNYGWDGNEEEERKIINNIATAFDIAPDNLIQVIDAKTKKRNVIQMLRHNDVSYHVSFNYAKRCVYIGQFQLGNMTGVSKNAQKRWAETLERNLPDILTASDRKAVLNRIQISGIGDKVIDKTLDAIERIYGDKLDCHFR